MLIIVAFWWVVALFWGMIHYDHASPSSLFYTGYLHNTLVFSAAALVFSFFLTFGYRWIRNGGLKFMSNRGIQSTIGHIPGLVTWERAKKTSVNIDDKKYPKLCEWLKKAPPEYLSVFNAIIDTIAAVPALPASPVKGGHGSFTLLEHTLNVVETGFSRLETWTFDRSKSDPLSGSALPNSSWDIAVLVLAGHDIGKMDAFNFDGKNVVSWRRSHDREGARILATMDEVWNLPEDDRKALIAAVAHEHHPQDLPTHTGSETRLLMEFLIDVDAEASQKEEGKLKITTEESISTVSTVSTVSVVEDEEDEAIWLWFLSYLAKPGTINGKDKRFRVGFKAAGGRIFLNEVSVRRVLAGDFYSDVSKAESKKGDGRFHITENLLRILDLKGVLIKDFGEEKYSYKNALFKVKSTNKDGKTLGEWSVAFVVNLGEFTPTNIIALSPAPNPPQLTGAVFHQRALKQEATSEENAHQDNTENSATLEGDDSEIVLMNKGDSDEESPTTEDPKIVIINEQTEENTEAFSAQVDGKNLSESSNSVQAQEETKQTKAKEDEKTPEPIINDKEEIEDLRSLDYGTKGIQALEDRNKNRRKKTDPNSQKEPESKCLAIKDTISCKAVNSLTELELTTSLHCKTSFGALYLAIKKGLELTPSLQRETLEDGRVKISHKIAAKSAGIGGREIHDIRTFAAAIGENHVIFNGLSLIRNDKSEIIEIILSTEEKDS
jgi:hypothetical protein